jgi:DNA-binding transcriptional LysR family regulator
MFIIHFMDIARVDLNLLRVLDALLREQHVSRAAKALHLSQPATSAALSRLRDALGDPLLVRTTRGMRPTERAVELAPQIRKLLENVSLILAPPAAFDPRIADMVLTVAATDYFIELANRNLAFRFTAESPNLHFAWRSLSGSPDLLEKMGRGEYDVAITTPMRAPESLRARLLMKEDFVGIIAKKNKSIKANGQIGLDAFCRLPQVLVSVTGNDPFRSAMDEALEARGLSRNVAFSVPQFRFAVDIVESTDVIAVFPARLAAQYGDRVRKFILPLSLPPFEIVMTWHERTHRSPPHQWLRKQLLEIAK